MALNPLKKFFRYVVLRFMNLIPVAVEWLVPLVTKKNTMNYQKKLDVLDYLMKSKNYLKT